MLPTPSTNSSSPRKYSATSGFESTQKSTAVYRVALERTMTGLYVGSMPHDQFLEDFLAEAPNPAPSVPVNAFKAVASQTSEPAMYEPFITALENQGNDLIPEFKIVNTSSHPDQNSEAGRKIKPDPTMYQSSVDTSENKTQFDKAEMNIEFKPRQHQDGFVDDPLRSFESSSLERSKTRSQLSDYAAEIFSRQHRRFLFTLLICGSKARFIRWDRAGAIISDAFDYCENPEPLAEFFWRFTHLTDANRGIDTSVRSANPREVILAKDKLAEWAPDKERPVVVFTIPGTNDKPREFIAWAPLATPASVTGRCTRAYPVYEIATGKRYFLKDVWRAHDLDPEAKILCELADAGVTRIPKYECGGDIEGDTTMTDLYVTAEDDPSVGTEHAADPLPSRRHNDWLKDPKRNRITRRIHHRFVVDFIGKPLSTFKSSKQCVQVVSDAFTAHKEAYEKCGIIHRDISAKNILIDEDGRGVLNDWDLAKHKSELLKRRRHEITGTWQFMSCLILSSTNHIVHTIQHDMESFVHVMLYIGLRYLAHSASNHTKDLIEDIFDYEVVKTNGISFGGRNKRALFMSPDYLGPGFQFFNVPLQRWMALAFRAVKEWIEIVAPVGLAFAIDSTAMQQHSQPASVLSATVNPPSQSPSHSLDDHTRLLGYFQECLSLDSWPSDDGPKDALSIPRPSATSSRLMHESDPSSRPIQETTTSSRRMQVSGASLRSMQGSATSSKRTRESTQHMEEDGSASAGGSRKRSRVASKPRRESISSTHPMNTRAQAKRAG